MKLLSGTPVLGRLPTLPANIKPGNTKGGSITVMSTSCLTGLESAVWQLTIFGFYMQNRLIQTSQTGGQWYSDTSPLSIPWLNYSLINICKLRTLKSFITLAPGVQSLYTFTVAPTIVYGDARKRAVPLWNATIFNVNWKCHNLIKIYWFIFQCATEALQRHFKLGQPLRSEDNIGFPRKML